MQSSSSGLQIKVQGDVAARINYYFNVRQLLKMGISLSDIKEMDEQDMEYLFGIELAIREIEREEIDNNHGNSPK